MIDAAGNAKIMDFGIARITDTRTVTPTGMVMGTVEYMAPEQIMGAPIDGRVDQFALAVVAYQMMTGSTLFGPNTIATLTYKIVNETPTPPCTRNAALPRGVDAVIAKGLAKNPIGRFANCGEFVSALAQAYAEAATAPLAPPTSLLLVTQPVPAPLAATVAAPAPRGSKAGLAAAAALGALVVGGGLAMVVWKPWSHTDKQQPAAVAEVTPAHPAAPQATPEPAPAPVEPKAAPKSEVRETQPESKAKAESPPSKAEPHEAKVEVKPEPPPPPPPKPEPVVEARVGPPKAGGAPPKVAPPAAAKDVEPEPIEAPEPMVLPPEPPLKTGANPNPYTLAMQQGQQAVKANHYVIAIQSFAKAISLRPQAPQAHYSRGQAYQHLEQYEAAVRDYNDTVHLEPTFALAYTGLGGCLARLHREAEAFEDFQRAIQLKPDAVLALAGRGNIYLHRKQYRLAAADYDKALAIDPRYAPVYQNRALAREAIGDFSGAAADRRRSTELRKQ